MSETVLSLQNSLGPYNNPRRLVSCSPLSKDEEMDTVSLSNLFNITQFIRKLIFSQLLKGLVPDLISSISDISVSQLESRIHQNVDSWFQGVVSQPCQLQAVARENIILEEYDRTKLIAADSQKAETQTGRGERNIKPQAYASGEFLPPTRSHLLKMCNTFKMNGNEAFNTQACEGHPLFKT